MICRGIARVAVGGGGYNRPRGTGWWCRRWGRSGGEGSRLLASKLGERDVQYSFLNEYCFMFGSFGMVST
nr:hypothetical protein [Tanacetum cinerariifolium]